MLLLEQWVEPPGPEQVVDPIVLLLEQWVEPPGPEQVVDPIVLLLEQWVEPPGPEQVVDPIVLLLEQWVEPPGPEQVVDPIVLLLEQWVEPPGPEQVVDPIVLLLEQWVEPPGGRTRTFPLLSPRGTSSWVAGDDGQASVAGDDGQASVAGEDSQLSLAGEDGPQESATPGTTDSVSRGLSSFAMVRSPALFDFVTGLGGADGMDFEVDAETPARSFAPLLWPQAVASKTERRTSVARIATPARVAQASSRTGSSRSRLSKTTWCATLAATTGLTLVRPYYGLLPRWSVEESGRLCRAVGVDEIERRLVDSREGTAARTRRRASRQAD